MTRAAASRRRTVLVAGACLALLAAIAVVSGPAGATACGVALAYLAPAALLLAVLGTGRCPGADRLAALRLRHPRRGRPPACPAPRDRARRVKRGPLLARSLAGRAPPAVA